jgi:hypothetical protein
MLKLTQQRVSRYMRKGTGDSVQKGEIVAAPSGLLGRLRNCRSPVDGQIVAVRNGMILIEAAPETFELRAHLKGQVSNIMPEVGVVISAAGALIQGIWGCGGEAEGVLKVLIDNPDKPLRARAIDVSSHGTLIVGSHISDGEVFKQAIEAKVRGLIAGSADASLCPQLEELPFPVLLTEGFGDVPMSSVVFSMLHNNMGREAMISTQTQPRWDVKRPEIIIPLRADGAMPGASLEPQALQEGTRIRGTRAPYLGAIGTVIQLPALSQPIESGARLPVAEIELENRDRVLIPLANLEIIQ